MLVFHRLLESGGGVLLFGLSVTLFNAEHVQGQVFVSTVLSAFALFLQGTTLHDRVNESVKSQISSCDELLSALDNLSSQQNFITKLMAILSESQALVCLPLIDKPIKHLLITNK